MIICKMLHQHQRALIKHFRKGRTLKTGVVIFKYQNVHMENKVKQKYFVYKNYPLKDKRKKCYRDVYPNIKSTVESVLPPNLHIFSLLSTSFNKNRITHYKSVFYYFFNSFDKVKVLKVSIKHC